MIIAYGDSVLVRIVEKEVKTGILLMPKEKKEFQIGCVVSIGADLPIAESNEGGGLEVGSYVYTRQYAGLPLEYDGVEYIALQANDILAFSKECK